VGHGSPARSWLSGELRRRGRVPIRQRRGRDGFDPIANISWVRALILYAILDIVYQVFTQITIGRFDIVSFIIGILVAVLVLVLYPNKPALWMQGGMSSGARA